MRGRLLATLVLLDLVACSSPAPGGGGDASAPDGAVDAADAAMKEAADPVDGTAPACPAAGSPCAGEGDGCSEGDPVEIACRTILVCRQARWERPQIFLTCGPRQQASACPATPPVDAQPCSVRYQLCSYAIGASCACVTGCESGVDAGACNRPLAWRCPAVAAACPTAAPQLGSPCAGTASCEYGPHCSSYRVVCRVGRWQPVSYLPFGGCG